MKRYHLKKGLALLIAGLMVIMLAACASSGSSGGKGEEASTAFSEEEDQTEVGMPPAVAAEVDLPKGAESMRHPVSALLLSTAADGLPYYGYEKNATDDNADAFFSPMSLLATMVEQDPELSDGQKPENGYYKISEEAFSCYASALFDSYGMQQIEAPELSEENPYAIENEDDEYPYSFTAADYSDYRVAIISCTEDEDQYGYELVAELRDAQDKYVLYEASFKLIPSSFEGDQMKDVFAYSISAVYDEQDYGFVRQDREGEPEETGDDSLPGLEETESDPQGTIDEKEALDIAKEYAERDDLEYAGTESLEGQDFYSYTYKDEEGETHNVLVPFDGTEAISGKKNGDGSWRFDE